MLPCAKLPMGRACIEHYRLLKRQCVFSHDELVCRMASLPAGTLDLTMSVMVYQDMVAMVEEERTLRKQLLDSVCTSLFWTKPHTVLIHVDLWDLRNVLWDFHPTNPGLIPVVTYMSRWQCQEGIPPKLHQCSREVLNPWLRECSRLRGIFSARCVFALFLLDPFCENRGTVVKRNVSM